MQYDINNVGTTIRDSPHSTSTISAGCYPRKVPTVNSGSCRSLLTLMPNFVTDVIDNNPEEFSKCLESQTQKATTRLGDINREYTAYMNISQLRQDIIDNINKVNKL